jgi:hypothetical protein
MTKENRLSSDTPSAERSDGPSVSETASVPGAAPGKTLSPEAARALEEAEARRQAAASDPARQELPTEIDGRAGPEPTRYGDWEKKGIAVDF